LKLLELGRHHRQPLYQNDADRINPQFWSTRPLPRYNEAEAAMEKRNADCVDWSVLDDVRVWLRPVAAQSSGDEGPSGIKIRRKRTGVVMLCLDPAALFDPASLDAALCDGKELNEITLDDGIEGANLRGADLTEATLEWHLLIRANLEEASLEHADLAGTCFRQANLRNACLRHAWCHMADFEDAVLVNADLTSAVLKKADLNGANLTGANLTDSDLQYARYDSPTRWPYGFDPARHGAVNIR
jgi:hypothetical protein